MKTKKNNRSIAFYGLVLFLVLVMIVSGLLILESTVFYDRELAGEQIATKTVTKDGVRYFPRQDITVLMVLGIDQDGPVQAGNAQENERNADMVALIIFDERSQNGKVLSLNRDTMLNIPVLNDAGKPVGSYYGQLTLSHLYGTGLKDSSENTRTAVSNFLNGIRIDHYVAMNMDAIAILNDALGGVTVNVTDDFSGVDPSITKGQYTLRGEQAITYVQSRSNLGDELNVSRMERQKEYFSAFLSALMEKNQSSDSFVVSAYEKVVPYIVTDCSASVLSELVDRYADYSIVEFVTPEGENVLGEEYYEFYPDEEKLEELVLRLFYSPK